MATIKPDDSLPIQVQKLAKSTLAKNVKDTLELSKSAEEKIRQVRQLVTFFITQANNPPRDKEIESLAKSVLARQVGDILNNEEATPEQRVDETRKLVQYFIIES